MLARLCKCYLVLMKSSDKLFYYFLLNPGNKIRGTKRAEVVRFYYNIGWFGSIYYNIGWFSSIYYNIGYSDFLQVA